jgi:hypothetical protein
MSPVSSVTYVPGLYSPLLLRIEASTAETHVRLTRPRLDHTQRSPTPALAADAPYVWALACLYLLLCAALLPREDLLRAVGSAVLVFGALHVEGSLRRGRRMLHIASLALTFALIVVLVAPTIPSLGGRGGGVSTVLGFVGVQIALLVRGVARWSAPVQDRASLPARRAFPKIVGKALLVALGVSAIATVPIGLGLVSGSMQFAQVRWIYAAYVVAALGIAVTVWGLQSLLSLATGRYLIGVLSASIAYGAVGLAVEALSNDRGGFAFLPMHAIVLGGIVGPAIAFDRDAFARYRLDAP